MKNRLILGLLLLCPVVFGQVRNKQTINENWKFSKGEMPGGVTSAAFDAQGWETVNIPDRKSVV